MGGLPSTVTNESILEYPFPRKSVVMSLKKKKKKNLQEAVTRDMASSDGLKLAALCLFCAQSVSINKSIFDFAGQDRKVIDRHSYLIHSGSYLF